MTTDLVTTTDTAVAPTSWVKAVTSGAHVSDPIPTGPLKGFSRGIVETIKATVAKGAPDEQLFVFMLQAVQYGLDPFKKQIWCVNMAGKDQAPQWMVAPSRDGYLVAAMRHPKFAAIRSDVVRKGDTFAYDSVAGTVDHRPDFFGGGAIVGAWAMVTRRDGTSIVKVVRSVDVKRSTPIWGQHEAKMTVKCAETLALKYGIGLDGLTVSDEQLERIEALAEMDEALLVDHRETEYVDGFPVGISGPSKSLRAQPMPDPGPVYDPDGEAWVAVMETAMEAVRDMEPPPTEEEVREAVNLLYTAKERSDPNMTTLEICTAMQAAIKASDLLLVSRLRR